MGRTSIGWLLLVAAGGFWLWSKRATRVSESASDKTVPGSLDLSGVNSAVEALKDLKVPLSTIQVTTDPFKTVQVAMDALKPGQQISINAGGVAIQALMKPDLTIYPRATLTP